MLPWLPVLKEKGESARGVVREVVEQEKERRIRLG